MRAVAIVLLVLGIPDAALGQPPASPAAHPAVSPAAYPAPVAWVETFQRDGLFFRGGSQAFWVRSELGWPAVDAQVGWTFGSTVSVFASGSMGLLLGNDIAGFTLAGGGVRLWRGVAFVDVRVAQMLVRTTCEFDDPCDAREGTFASAGLGRDLGLSPYFRFDVHGQVVRMSDGVTGVVVGFGMSFYPFQRASSRYRRL